MSPETANFLAAQHLIYTGNFWTLLQDPLWLYKWTGVLKQGVLICCYSQRQHDVLQAVLTMLDINARSVKNFLLFIYHRLIGNKYTHFTSNLYVTELINLAELLNVLCRLIENNQFSLAYTSVLDELFAHREKEEDFFKRDRIARTLCNVKSLAFRELVSSELMNVNIDRENLEQCLEYLAKLGGNESVNLFNALSRGSRIYQALIDSKHLNDDQKILAYRREFSEIIKWTTKKLPFSERVDLFKSIIDSNNFSVAEKQTAIDSLATVNSLSAVWELRQLSESSNVDIAYEARRVLRDLLSPVGAVAMAYKLEQAHRSRNVELINLALDEVRGFVSDAAHFQRAVYQCVIDALEAIKFGTEISPDVNSRASGIVELANRYRAKLAAGIPLYQSDSVESKDWVYQR